MSIRMRILLTLPPLFLALGVTSGFLAYQAVMREVTWGLEEEASSLAVTVAEFVGALTPDPGQRDEALDRLLEYGQAKSIELFSPEGELVHRAGAGSSGPVAPPLPAGILQAISDGAPVQVLEALDGVGAQGLSLAGWATIPDGGAVRVAVDATALDESAAGVLWRFGVAAFLFTLAGTLGAGLTATYLSREVGVLGSAALRVAEGDHRSRIRVGRVHEISELANTLNTLSSLLEDSVHRGRTLLLRQSGGHDPKAVALRYRGLSGGWEGKGGWREIAGVRVLQQRVGVGEAGDLFGARERSGSTEGTSGGVAWAGRMAGENDLQEAMAANAFQRLLDARLREEDPVAVVRESVELFQPASLDLSWWDSNGENLRYLSWNGEEFGDVSTPTFPLSLRSFREREGWVLDRWLALGNNGLPEDLDSALGPGLAGVASGRILYLEREGRAW